MRICVPIETESGIDSKVCDHFGRAPFLAVADTRTGHVDVQPSAGCQAHQDHQLGWLRATGIDAVFCKGLGRGALIALRKAGIRVYFTERDGLSAIIKDIREQRMMRLPEERVCGGGTHHH